jgi:hypothetical protein
MLFSHSPIQATWQSRTTILVNSELKSDQEWMISSFVSGSSKGDKDHEVSELSSEMCLLPQMSVAYCANENKEVFHFSQFNFHWFQGFVNYIVSTAIVMNHTLILLKIK